MSEQLSPIECHVPVTSAAANAVDLLADASGLSKQKIKDAMAKGAVWLSQGRQKQRLRRAKKALRQQQTLHLYYDAGILQRPLVPAQLVDDLGRYSVWNKPAGMLAQGSVWGDHCSLLRFAEQFFQPPRNSYLVHRLDREAQGLMLVAHDADSAGKLSALFQQRQLVKRYHVAVDGNFVERTGKRELRVDTALDGKTAVSQLQLLDYDADTDQSRLQVTIETGRKHQIRRHCAAIGLPVIGDSRYGRFAADGLQLQASLLEFDCPVTGRRQSFAC